MFNLETVKHLQGLSARPSVTITLPTYRTSPDNQKDPIRLKNLVTETTNRLEAEYGKRETLKLREQLQELADSVNHEHNLDGLALFVSAAYQEVFKLPYRLPERVVLDDTFLTRDLVFAMNRTPQYLALMLTEKPTRLYLGRGPDLHEVRDYGFPREYSGPGTGVAVQMGIGASPSREIERALEEFMRQVDTGLRGAVQALPFPVVLVGLSENLGMFKRVSRNTELIVTEVEGGHDHLSAHDLGELIWPQMQAALRERRQDIFEQIEQASGHNRTVSDLDEAWQAALDGQVDTMVVEQNLHFPARVSQDGRRLTRLPSGGDGPDDAADAVDEMIEHVMQRGGRAVFVDDGELAATGGMVMLTRY
ncbi:hypothetical protein FNU79_17945 [Deinococcus detaillensis]|uniref:Uncharacterized protein n=1 Tax=Deinococcus detaillensis TaxID=2592048 RepID=A0A553UH08_9DEIO|nr:hypothetical protein [Deinococcus detaillensis]TSA79416.1 hypothetical protein FNU79_17945 [Deinococcus detaillensis]